MFCPKCGKENKSNQKWCCYCGTILDISSGEVQSEKPQAEERSTARKPQKNESPQQNTTQKLRGTQKKAPKRRKSSKGTIAVIAGVLVLAAIIASCLFIIPSGNRHGDSESDSVAGDDGKRLTFHRSDAAHIVKDANTGCSFVDNELIISFDEMPDISAVEAVSAPYGGTVAGINDYLNTYQILFDREYTYAELTEIADVMRTKLPVKDAILNYYMELDLFGYTPDDKKWADEWGDTPSGKNWNLEAIHAPDMWEVYKANSHTPINVGVLDNQFYEDHEDLKFQEFYLNEFNGGIKQANHGTHVSGIIAASFNNGMGIAGIAPDVNLYGASVEGLRKQSVKKDSIGITVCEYDAGFAFLIGKKNCKIINLSYGGTFEDPIPKAAHMEESLQVLLDDGYDFLIVKGAGNERMNYQNYDFFTLFRNQSVLDRIITVGAAELGENGNIYIWEGSNYGDSIDLIAPGKDILSTTRNIILIGITGTFHFDLGSTYEYKNGTSMATPHVSGVAAAIWSCYPELSAPEIKNIIISSASGIYHYSDTIHSIKQGDTTIYYQDPTLRPEDNYQYPMLDAYAAIKMAGEVAENYTSSEPETNDEWAVLYENYVLNQNTVYENDPNLIDTKSFTLDGLKYYKDRYSEPKFALYDVDSNNTPELIIFNGCPFMAEAQCHVFTCDNGQLKYAGPIGFRGCALYFYPEGQYRGLFCSDGNMGQFRTYYYSIKDGAAAQELVKEYTFDDTGKVVNTPATSNKGLYEQSTGGDGTALPFFTIGEIREMGWETFVQKALNPEASPKADGLAVFDSDEQYDMNIYLSNISEQRAFEKNGYSWNHEDLVNFAFTWCKINRYSALGSAEDGGHYFFTLPLDTVNEVLKRFFNITLYDQDMRREHLPDPYSPSAYNFYRDGYFYYPAASGEMHYNYLSVVKQKEPAGQGQYTLYFDVYALLDSVYKANDYSVPKDFYRLSSEKAASDPGLTMVASGKAFIREYEENGLTQRYIVEYSMD